MRLKIDLKKMCSQLQYTNEDVISYGYTKMVINILKLYEANENTSKTHDVI